MTEVIGTVNNTQNIWLAVDQGVHYKLRVEPLSGSFNHSYALAWQLRPFDDYDQDGSFDHQDPNVRDPCLPDASFCSMNIPIIMPTFYYILGILLFVITRNIPLNTRAS